MLPTIASSSYGAFGLTVTAVNGSSVTISAERILAVQKALKSANRTTHQMAVTYWVVFQLVAALGEANLDASQVLLTYNQTTGAVTGLQFYP